MYGVGRGYPAVTTSVVCKEENDQHSWHSLLPLLLGAVRIQRSFWPSKSRSDRVLGN